MTDKLDKTTFLAGDFISHRAVRAALDRRSRSRNKRTTAGLPDQIAPAETSARPAQPRRQLRRWSVAALLAGAVPRPASGGTSH